MIAGRLTSATRCRWPPEIELPLDRIRIETGDAVAWFRSIAQTDVNGFQTPFGWRPDLYRFARNCHTDKLASE
jgi:hypothetical protein